LGQEFAHPLALRQHLGRVESMFQRERRERASPSAVWGPVLAPPCMRHLPLLMAGERQGIPQRVLAFPARRQCES